MTTGPPHLTGTMLGIAAVVREESMSPIPVSTTSRRAVLGAGAAALAASAVHLVGRAAPAAAANNDPVLLGASTSASQPTQITNTQDDEVALRVSATGSGMALVGEVAHTFASFGYYAGGTGVIGTNDDGIGVAGYSETFHGLYGYSQSGRGATIQSDAGDEPAIFGIQTNGKTAVYGYVGGVGNEPASPDLTGVYGYVGPQTGTTTGVDAVLGG